jgi:hypothetical protein
MAKPRVSSTVSLAGSLALGSFRTDGFLSSTAAVFGVSWVCEAEYPIKSASNTKAGIGQSFVHRILRATGVAVVVAGRAVWAEVRCVPVLEDCLLGGRIASLAHAFIPGVQ